MKSSLKTKHVSVTIPFGEGEATLCGFFSPEEKIYDYPIYPSSLEVTKFVVGGNNILDEVVSAFVGVGIRRHEPWLDYYIEKAIDKIEDNPDSYI